MKKQIAAKLLEIANGLPLVYDIEPIKILESGYRLNLSALGENQKVDDGMLYEIDFFQLRAVEHKQQVKDAFKNGGFDGVNEYFKSVIKKARLQNNSINHSQYANK